MRIAVVVGTRPEIIKMSPVVEALIAANHEVKIVHTGQHYSHDMDRIFFDDLGLPAPTVQLDVGSGKHGQQTGTMMQRLEPVFEEMAPDWVLVQGDTNTVLAGALVAAKLHIRVGHVEAGLRSGDRKMPEELNRIATDHLSDLLFAPTEEAAENLRREGIPTEKILVTGNTIVDAVLHHRQRALQRPVTGDPYILLTAHRAENVDDLQRLKELLQGAKEAAQEHKLRIIFPIHPRTRRRLDEANEKLPGIEMVSPTGFLEFIALQARAQLVLTDSGGVQEESCILGVPCVTLRDSTERPETISVGANRLAGTKPDKIVQAAREAMQSKRDWPCPFGLGDASTKIVAAIS